MKLGETWLCETWLEIFELYWAEVKKQVSLLGCQIKILGFLNQIL